MEICSGPWSLAADHPCLERARLPAATGPGLVLAWWEGTCTYCFPGSDTRAWLFLGLPSPTPSLPQLPASKQGEALLACIPWAASTRTEPWRELGLVWALPSRRVSALAQLYFGFFCFAPTMQWEQPRSQQPRASLAREMLQASLCVTLCVMSDWDSGWWLWERLTATLCSPFASKGSLVFGQGSFMGRSDLPEAWGNFLS